MISLHMEHCNFISIDIRFFIELSVWYSRRWSFMLICISVQARRKHFNVGGGGEI